MGSIDMKLHERARFICFLYKTVRRFSHRFEERTPGELSLAVLERLGNALRNYLLSHALCVPLKLCWEAVIQDSPPQNTLDLVHNVDATRFPLHRFTVVSLKQCFNRMRLHWLDVSIVLVNVDMHLFLILR